MALGQPIQLEVSSLSELTLGFCPLSSFLQSRFHDSWYLD